jgi:hypothetical protein
MSFVRLAFCMRNLPYAGWGRAHQPPVLIREIRASAHSNF